MGFIHDDFLLSTEAARRLYHDFAEEAPILDYHNHLPPAEIAKNRRYENLAEIWLGGDHYKWRAMRSNGIPERLCTGDADPYEKFLAWAQTVPQTLRNPLYHWTHLELKRCFDIDELLDETTAPAIWKRTGEMLAGNAITPHALLTKFKVTALCTTDDPTDDLADHKAIAQSDLKTRVYPTFRPDKGLTVDAPDLFNPWVDRLAAAADQEIGTYADFLAALRQRHDAFHAIGCCLSDHGLETCFADFCDDATASKIFDQARRGEAASPGDHARFATHVMCAVGRMDAERGWTMQLHLGPLRNNCTRLYRQLGADIGCDSVGDAPQARALSAFLDRLDQDGTLPKTILYNINPADNYVFASMIGNFQDGSIPGKIQFGSGWWTNDQWEAMEWQINALSNLGLLSRFIGMLTDSRSFLSFPRHEYFRRCLCNLLGRDMESGAIPNDDALVGGMVRNICYENAKQYLGLEVGSLRGVG